MLFLGFPLKQNSDKFHYLPLQFSRFSGVHRGGSNIGVGQEKAVYCWLWGSIRPTWPVNGAIKLPCKPSNRGTKPGDGRKLLFVKAQQRGELERGMDVSSYRQQQTDVAWIGWNYIARDAATEVSLERGRGNLSCEGSNRVASQREGEILLFVQAVSDLRGPGERGIMLAVETATNSQVTEKGE